MTRGVYITANDKAQEQTIAFLNSFRLYDPDTPIILIPYDTHYQQIAKLLSQSYNIEVYEDLDFIDRLSVQLQQIFGEKFFARPHQFRKQACWFGPFDEFLYIDTDIVVFEKIIDRLNLLNKYDFLCNDYQYMQGISNIFSPKIIEANIFTDTELLDVFNGGFWASKKNLLSEETLYEIFTECAARPEYFDFSRKTSDQPIINYMILKKIKKRCNLVRYGGKNAGNWAGTPYFERVDNYLVDPKVNQRLQYLHWAGFRLQPGCPYWDIWLSYRYLNEEIPTALLIPPTSTEKTFLEQSIAQIKKILKSK